MNVSSEKIVIYLAIITSPLIIGIFTYIKNKFEAWFKFRGYQAIFLNSSDGQTYFAKITSISNKDITIKDIYYIRKDNRKLSLAKLGSEIHGPKDRMYINREHVLFIENLKNDGETVKAILKFKQ
jgi:hypothetical protein